MEIGGYQDFKNEENRARWLWRWAQQGGSMHWKARDLLDLRNAGDLERWRVTEHKLRHTPKSKKKVINLAAVRIERAKRKRA
jgi:hypothetical protein